MQDKTAAAKLEPLRVLIPLAPVALSAIVGIATSGYAQTPAPAAASAKTKTSASKHKPAYKGAAKSATLKASTAKSSTTKSSASVSTSTPAPAGKRNAKSSKTQVASYRRSSQQQPTPERFQEIQQALVERGYFAGPADGKW